MLAVSGRIAGAASTARTWPGRWWRAVKRYPIPFGAVTLMLASLVLWLAGRGTIASWTLLAVALLGGIPLLVISVGLGALLATRGDAPVGLLTVVIAGLTIDAYYFALLRGLRRFGWLAIYRVAANLAQLIVIAGLALVLGVTLSLEVVIAVYSLIYIVPIVVIELVDGPGALPPVPA